MFPDSLAQKRESKALKYRETDYNQVEKQNSKEEQTSWRKSNLNTIIEQRKERLPQSFPIEPVKRQKHQ